MECNYVLGTVNLSAIDGSSLPNDLVKDYQTCLSRESFKTRIPVVVFLTIVACMGFVGNLVAIWVYSVEFRLSANRIFILCMGIQDLLTSSLGLPLQIFTIYHAYDVHSIGYCRAMFFFTTVPTHASSATLVAVAVDRFHRIWWPHKRHISSRWAVKVSVGITFVSWVIFGAFVPLYGTRTVPSYVGNLSVIMCWIHDDYENSPYKEAFIFVVEAFFYSSFLFMAGSYLLIGIQLWRRSKSRQRRPSIFASMLPIKRKSYGFTPPNLSPTEEKSHKNVPVQTSMRLPHQPSSCPSMSTVTDTVTAEELTYEGSMDKYTQQKTNTKPCPDHNINEDSKLMNDETRKVSCDKQRSSRRTPLGSKHLVASDTHQYMPAPSSKRGETVTHCPTSEHLAKKKISFDTGKSNVTVIVDHVGSSISSSNSRSESCIHNSNVRGVPWIILNRRKGRKTPPNQNLTEGLQVLTTGEAAGTTQPLPDTCHLVSSTGNPGQVGRIQKGEGSRMDEKFTLHPLRLSKDKTVQTVRKKTQLSLAQEIFGMLKPTTLTEEELILSLNSPDGVSLQSPSKPEQKKLGTDLQQKKQSDLLSPDAAKRTTSLLSVRSGAAYQINLLPQHVDETTPPLTNHASHLSHDRTMTVITAVVKMKRHLSRQQRRLTTRTTRMMAVITLCYILNWLPHVIIRKTSIEAINLCDEFTKCGANNLHALGLRSLFLSSAVNAYIYSIFSRVFREKCKRLVKSYWFRLVLLFKR